MLVRNVRLTCRSLAFALALLLAAAVPQIVQARKSILLVFDEDNDLPGLAVINRSLREALKSEVKDEVEFYSESLNVSQFKGADYDNVLSEHFRRKYAGNRPDLIVAVMEPSLDFLLRHGEALFAGIPIVFCGVDPSDIDRKALRSNVTGVLVKRTFAPTLEIALRLQPYTRNVFVVGGTSRFDRQLQAIARRDFEPMQSRMRITYLTELPFDGLLNTLSNLPERSVIVYLTVFADGAGRAFVPHEALSAITRVASAPVYVSVDQYVGLGAVGGHVYSVDTHGRHTAEIGVRILRGEAPSTIPVVELAAYSDRFDWRQLQRWKLDETHLPAGSQIAFRTPSVWDLYKWYILGGALVVLLQSALIVGLLVSHARFRRAESARKESDQRRQRAEEEAQRQRDELAHALRVTTLGELTASFAHELGQPLTAIIANAQAARRLLAAGQVGGEEARGAIADIAAAASGAVETIRRLRALFRKEHAERVPVDMNTVIDDVLGLLRADIEAKHIDVHFTHADHMPTVMVDPVQVRQVVMNLLVNAEEAIGLAGAGPREIRIRAGCSDAEHLLIAVSDSGIGLQESELERIFEHFVSSKPHGLGMGLAISRSIVEAHGGRLWATRNIDRGITLNVELPVSIGAEHDRGS